MAAALWKAINCSQQLVNCLNLGGGPHLLVATDTSTAHCGTRNAHAMLVNERCIQLVAYALRIYSAPTHDTQSQHTSYLGAQSQDSTLHSCHQWHDCCLAVPTAAAVSAVEACALLRALNYAYISMQLLLLRHWARRLPECAAGSDDRGC
jgi:hypothetical protein